MKILLRKLYFILLLFFHMAMAVAQNKSIEDFILEGIVTDQHSGAVIPHASISILHTTSGTACDELGQFRIRLENSVPDQKIKVSCIGYKTKILSIDSLRGVKRIDIRLDAETIILSEVLINGVKIDPAQVVKDAINSISRNYYNKNFNMEFHSTISTFDSAKKAPYKIESIVFAYYKGYVPATELRFQFLHKRETGVNPLKVKCTSPSFDFYDIDLITSPFRVGVFNLENFPDFRFKYSGVSIYDKDSVYIVEYEAVRPSSKITGLGKAPQFYRGKIFITIHDNAIVKHRVEVDWLESEIIYRKINGYYFPYYIEGTRILNPSKKQKFRVKNSIALKTIKLENVSIIRDKEDDYCLENISFDKEYWNSNYPEN